MKIAIAGAGIGGLVAALSLKAAGFDNIAVYERAPVVRGLGVGINLLPHAIRELTELGIADRVAALGVAPSTLSYFNRHGQLIWSEPRGLSAGYEWPQLSVHRGRLQLLLRDLVAERLGDVVRLGHSLTNVYDGDSSVQAEFETERGMVDVDADLLVGADGIHSSLRALRFPEDRGPVWGGLTLWRGTSRVRPFLDGKSMIMVGDGDQKFVAYPLEAPHSDGLQRVNFIAERRGQGSANADWNRSVNPAPIVEHFRQWRYDWLDVPELIGAAEEILEYPMADRDALPRWSFGRTTLIGDAAHAMYPNGSNGGSQAILDARTLAYRLATSSSVEAALSLYESDRRPATARLLEMTRKTGPERVMLLAHERAPHGFGNVEEVITRSELEQIAADYKTAAGFHPELLNERSGLTVRS